MYLESIYNENILVNIKDLNNYLKSNSNINNFLLEVLKSKIGNKCNNDGLIINDSINIIYRDCGVFKHNENILYKIKYTTKILFPTEGCILNNCKIVFISSILYIAKMKENNIIIIIPRSFINKPIDVKKNKYLSILCLEKYYELNDKFMFIIGIPYLDSIPINKINTELENDEICKNIFHDITEFKLEFENLFNKLQEDEEEQLLINYEDNNTQIELNTVLVNFKEQLDLYIKENSKEIKYKINVNSLNNYESIYNIYQLLNLKIDSLSKHNLFTNFDIYLKNKNQLKYNNFIETNNSFTLNNDFTYCYINSSLQLLKNCKLFVKSFYDLFDSLETAIDKNDNKYKLYLELNNIFNGYQNSIDKLYEILKAFNESKNIDFDFSRLNNVEDFIIYLFSLLDEDINNELYIKNVYDDVAIKTTQTNIENNIGFYISELNKSNKTNILHKFYNINVSEYKCSTCLFRFYHIKNNLNSNLFINNNDNILKCIHSLNFVPQLIDGFECSVCNNSTVYKSTYIYINPTDYLMCSLNRVLFEEILNKDNNEIFINNRITFKNVDINSTNSIKTNDFVLDLKTVICQTGTLSNGHYICLNKNSNNSFTLYDDNKKYIVTMDKFFINSLFKSSVCNVVYQLNNINSSLSDILLLEYEEDYLNDETKDKFINYIKNNNRLGINIQPKIITGGSQVIQNTDNILFRLFNLNLVSNEENFIDALNHIFNTNLNNKKDEFNNIINNFYDENTTIILPKIDELYSYLIHKFIFNFKDLIIKDSTFSVEFLNSNSLYKNLINIKIGTSGYNTYKTNHWDVIYQHSNNNLEFYSNHFNTIEINDTYYQDFDNSYWSSLSDRIEELDSNMAVSVVFNKELTDILLNNSENSDLEQLFIDTFNKYYTNKIELANDYINNIVFIFDSSFVYNEINLNNLQFFKKQKSNLNIEPNIIFEFNDDSWFNNVVANYCIENDFSIATLIINNNNNDFGYNISTNVEFINSYNFMVNYIKLYGSITKFNGSHEKDLYMLLNHILSNNNKNSDKKNINLSLSKLERSNLYQYIYFNNIETDFMNKRYKKNINELDINSLPKMNQDNLTESTTSEKDDSVLEDDENDNIEKSEETMETMETMEALDIDTESLNDNLNIPSAVFDAKCFYKLLEKLNNLKK